METTAHTSTPAPTVPDTLLLTLDEPVSTRAAVLGAVAVLALGVGIGQRWAAPFLAGSAVLVVLAVRHLEPVAEALPRWISLGAVGALLLTLDEVARELRCARRSVERQIARHRLTVVHVGRSVRVERRKLERFIAQPGPIE